MLIIPCCVAGPGGYIEFEHPDGSYHIGDIVYFKLGYSAPGTDDSLCIKFSYDDGKTYEESHKMIYQNTMIRAVDKYADDSREYDYFLYNYAVETAGVIRYRVYGNGEGRHLVFGSIESVAVNGE